MTPLVAATGLAAGYPGRALLQEVNLEITGGLIGIVGPNGSGKTTLLKTLAGLLPALSGQVTRKAGLRVGYVPQKLQLDPVFPLSVREVVEMGRYPGWKLREKLSPADREQVRLCLERLHLMELAERPYRLLSGGQKQRVLVARALAGEPELLYLDEPTDGLDVAGETRLLALVAELRQEAGFAVVMVSQDLNVVARRATTVWLVQPEERRLLQGEAASVLIPDLLDPIYGVRFVTVQQGERAHLVVQS